MVRDCSAVKGRIGGCAEYSRLRGGDCEARHGDRRYVRRRGIGGAGGVRPGDDEGEIKIAGPTVVQGQFACRQLKVRDVLLRWFEISLCALNWMSDAACDIILDFMLLHFKLFNLQRLCRQTSDLRAEVP